MDMIQPDNAENTPAEPRTAKSMENLTCLTIRTGNADCIARFYPSLYQLTLVKGGIEEKVDLGFSGSRLLERLVRNPGEVVDRDDLMSHAWSGRVVGQGSLNQQIYTLRQILADESNREIIQTLPRRGYLVNPSYVDVTQEPVVTEAAPVEQPDQPSNQTLIPAAPEAAAPPAWRIATILLGGAGLLLLGVLIIWNTNAKPATNTAEPKLLTITYAPEAPEDLQRLLPFGEELNRQLTPKVKQPLQVVVGLHEEALDVVCLRADGSARTLHFHQSRAHKLDDLDLAPCLP